MRRPAAVIALMLLAALVTGCAGYRQGSLVHPDLKTVAIGEIRNASSVPHLEIYLRQHLAEQFSSDGTLRLTNLDDADCIIIAEVKDFDVAGIAETRVDSPDDDQRINRSTAFRANVRVHWRLDVANGSRPLLAPRETVGRGVYPERLDYVQAQERGLKQATYDAAQQIVVAVTEGW